LQHPARCAERERVDVAVKLRRADVLFGCTDNHWSRTVLNALAHQEDAPRVGGWKKPTM
jgi:hypothetical protein